MKGLVWAINEVCLPNFLTPRNCPRVTYHCNENTTENDKEMYLSSKTISHVVAIEHKWFEMMKNTTLYLYEFETKDYYLQDRGAGYYVDRKSTRLNSSHVKISYAVFCLKKKTN